MLTEKLGMKASAALLKVRTDTPGSFEEYSAPALPISAQSIGCVSNFVSGKFFKGSQVDCFVV